MLTRLASSYLSRFTLTILRTLPAKDMAKYMRDYRRRQRIVKAHDSAELRTLRAQLKKGSQ